MTSNSLKSEQLTDELLTRIRSEARDMRENLVRFTQRLVQTPSLPGDEAAVAQLVVSEMQFLGYDTVYVDEAGNVIGHIKATTGTDTKRVMFNTHLDHVDVGDEALWPHPPFAGEVEDGAIWGRGTSDLKGALACHVFAGALVKKLGVPIPNDIFVVGVVQEEVGGIGSSVLAGTLPCDFVVIGEPSANVVALGHRGRIEIAVTITGMSVHASVPESGLNPLYSMARFIGEVQRLVFEPDPAHVALGPTTIAPTVITTDQTSKNVIPGICSLILDVRNAPAETPQRLIDLISPLLERSLEPGLTGTAEVADLDLTTYTGVRRVLSGHGAFGVDPSSSFVNQVTTIVDRALERKVGTRLWRFATDAGYFVEKGMNVIGFGPGFEEVIHTINERISIEMMVEGVVANAALALALE